MKKLLFILCLFPSVSFAARLSGGGGSGSGSGSGSSSLAIKENGVLVSSPTAAIDFLGSDFNVSESPTGEANVSLDLSTSSTGAGNFIWNTDTAQDDPSRFNVSSGTIRERLDITGVPDSAGDSTPLYIHSPLGETVFGVRLDGYYSDGIRLDGGYATTNTSIANVFGFNDNSSFPPTATAKTAWSAGSGAIIYGTHTASGFYGFLSGLGSRPSGSVYSSTVTNLSSYHASPSWSSGHVVNFSMFSSSDIAIGGSGTIANAYGLNLGNVTGATNNYAIKTRSGLIQLGTPGTTSAMTFDPGGSGIINLYNSGSPNWGQNFYSGLNAVGYLNYGSSGFTIAVSTGFTTATIATRLNIALDGSTLIKNHFSENLFTIENSSISVWGARPITWMDSDSSNYVGFQSPSTVASNVIWTLPDADSSGCFQSDGSGNMSIGSCGSGGGLPLTPGDTNYIQVRTDSVQAGSTFYVRHGKVLDQGIIYQTASATSTVNGAGFTAINVGGTVQSFTFSSAGEATYSRSGSGDSVVLSPVLIQFGNETAFGSGAAAQIIGQSGLFTSNSNGGSVSVSGGVALGNGQSNVLLRAVAPGQGSGTTERNPTTSMSIGGSTITAYVPFRMFNQNEIRFMDADSSNYSAFRSSEVLAYNQDYVLPASTGTVDQVLAIQAERADGKRTLYWKTDTSGGGGSLPLTPGDTNYIQVRNDSLQAGATFFVSSGTIQGNFRVQTAAGKDVLNVVNTSTPSMKFFNQNTTYTYTSQDSIPEIRSYGRIVLSTVPVSTGVIGASLDIDHRGVTLGNPKMMRFFDTTWSDAFGTPRTFFDSAAGMKTISYITISGFDNGLTGDSFNLLDPVTNLDGYMLGIRGDVGQVNFVINTGSTANAYPMLVAQTATSATWAMEKSGAMFWSGGHNPNASELPSANASFDTNLYRSAANTLKTDDNLIVGSSLVVNGAGFRLNAYSTQTVSARGDIAIDTNTISSTMGTMLIHDGTQLLNVVVTTNTPSNGQIPKYNSSSGKVIWDTDNGGTGAPGGFDTTVQFNNGGAFGGDAELTWDTTGKVLSLSGATLNFTTGNDSITFTYPAAAGANSNTITIPTRSGTLMVESTITLAGFSTDGAGSAITAGSTNYFYVPDAATITGWTLMADTTGSITIDVKKCSGFNCAPVTSIVGSEKPTLSSVWANQDDDLSSWTTDLAAGDKLAFVIDSAATVTKIWLSITGHR